MGSPSIVAALGGRGHACQCPACAAQGRDRSRNNLSVHERDGKLLVKCFAGCEQDAVIAELRARGLWLERERQSWTPEPAAPASQRAGSERRPRGIPADAKLTATYQYIDKNGKLLSEKERYEWHANGKREKSFRVRSPNGRGGWTNRQSERRVLYRLSEVLEAPIVLYAEGEKDVETLREYGFVATTAGSTSAPWLDSFTQALAGREVVIIPDADKPGRARAAQVFRALEGHAAKLVILDLEGECKDITEWFERGHSELELIHILESEEVSQ